MGNYERYGCFDGEANGDGNQRVCGLDQIDGDKR